MSRTSEALTAQYLNVHQRKLGTTIIHTVHTLQQGGHFAWESHLLPNNLARQ
jgi:hypothetical protein